MFVVGVLWGCCWGCWGGGGSGGGRVGRRAWWESESGDDDAPLVRHVESSDNMLLLAITVSPFGTSPSWPTSLAHSLAFLSVLRFWTLTLIPSRGSSVGVLHITLVVAPGLAHAQGSLSGGMMRTITLWPPPSTVSQHSSFLQDPPLERVAWFCDVPLSPPPHLPVLWCHS